AFWSVVRREGSCRGSWVNTERMFAWWAPCVTLTCRLAPFSFEVRELVAAVNEGLNGRALQLPTWNGLGTGARAPNVDVSTESVARSPQLVGFRRKLGRLTATLTFPSRSGTPLTIAGRLLVV